MQYCSHVGFFTSLLLWDSAQAKVYKFDFRDRRLVVKCSATQMSSRIRAIRLVLISDERRRQYFPEKQEEKSQDFRLVLLTYFFLLSC